MNIKKHLEIAKKAAIMAGNEIMKIYATNFDSSIEIKADNSPLTVADKAANKVISDILSNMFLQIAILSEENTSDDARFENDWCWIVDPLDGTKEFIKKNGEFTVNIALTYRGGLCLV